MRFFYWKPFSPEVLQHTKPRTGPEYLDILESMFDSVLSPAKLIDWHNSVLIIIMWATVISTGGRRMANDRLAISVVRCVQGFNASAASSLWALMTSAHNCVASGSLTVVALLSISSWAHVSFQGRHVTAVSEYLPIIKRRADNSMTARSVDCIIARRANAPIRNEYAFQLTTIFNIRYLGASCILISP